MGLVRGSVCHYCLGGCSALVVCARRSPPGLVGWGQCWFLRLSGAPPPPHTPAFPALQVEGRPIRPTLPSSAGTPFHAVCAFRGLGSVALLVFFACPLCVCALAWFRCRATVGPFHAVCAPPCFLPRSRALSGLLGGGAARSLSPSTWLWVVCPLVGGPGLGGGGGEGGCVPSPLGGVAGGPRGARGRSTSVRPSDSPGRAPKQVASASLSPWRAWSPYCSGWCPRADPGCGPRGVFVRRRGTASLSRSLWERAGGGVAARGVWV